MPMRTTEIHVINQSWAFDACFQLFKPFLTERMRKQIFIHGSDLSSLHKHINASHLPERYGGKLPEYSYTEWMSHLVYDDKFISELKNLGYSISDKELEETKLKYGQKSI